MSKTERKKTSSKKKSPEQNGPGSIGYLADITKVIILTLQST